MNLENETSRRHTKRATVFCQFPYVRILFECGIRCALCGVIRRWLRTCLRVCAHKFGDKL